MGRSHLPLTAIPPPQTTKAKYKIPMYPYLLPKSTSTADQLPFTLPGGQCATVQVRLPGSTCPHPSLPSAHSWGPDCPPDPSPAVRSHIIFAVPPRCCGQWTAGPQGLWRIPSSMPTCTQSGRAGTSCTSRSDGGWGWGREGRGRPRGGTEDSSGIGPERCASLGPWAWSVGVGLARSGGHAVRLMPVFGPCPRISSSLAAQMGGPFSTRWAMRLWTES